MGIAGKYELASSDKYSDYLKAVGVSMLNRTMANSTKPTMEYIDLGNGKWTQKTITVLKTYEITIQSGVEFDETTIDDRKARSVVTVDGNTWVHKQTIDKYNSVTTRVFGETDMKTTFTSGDVSAVRVYKRVA